MTAIVMAAPARAMAVMMVPMDADIGTDAQAADMDAGADIGARGRRAEQSEGEKRSDQSFHGGFLRGRKRFWQHAGGKRLGSPVLPGHRYDNAPTPD